MPKDGKRDKKGQNTFSEPEIIQRIRRANSDESKNIVETIEKQIKISYVLSYLYLFTFSKVKDDYEKYELHKLADGIKAGRRIGIVGEMGAGKTSTMRALLEELNVTAILPIIIPFKYIKKVPNETFSIVEIILRSPVFQSLKLDKEDEEEFKKWFHKNHSTVCFLLDALDEANFKLTDVVNENLGSIKVEDKHPVDVIIGSILQAPHDPDRPRWMSVVSSRECTAREIVSTTMSPVEWYGLASWEDHQQKEFAKHVQAKLGKDTRGVWGPFESIIKNDCFKQMAKNPLAFQCMLDYIRNAYDTTNHTALLSYIILKFYESTHIQDVDKTRTVVEKFKSICLLAVHMVIDKECESLPVGEFNDDLFSANELDLLTTVSQGKGLGNKLRGNDVYKFNNSMIAYYCAAVGLYVFSSEEEFKKKVKKMFTSNVFKRGDKDEPQLIPYLEVLKFLFGCFEQASNEILISEIPSAHFPDFKTLETKKFNFLKKLLKKLLHRNSWLHSNFNSHLSIPQMFEMLYEMKNHDFIKEIAEMLGKEHLTFKNESFTSLHRIEAMAYVLEIIEGEKHVSFTMSSCKIDKYIDLIISALKEKTIKEINFTDCRLYDRFPLLADLNLQDSKVVAFKCGLKESDIRNFASKIVVKPFKDSCPLISTLNLSKNEISVGYKELRHTVLNQIKSKLILRDCYLGNTSEKAGSFFQEEMGRTQKKFPFEVDDGFKIHKYNKTNKRPSCIVIAIVCLLIITLLCLYFAFPLYMQQLLENLLNDQKEL